MAPSPRAVLVPELERPLLPEYPKESGASTPVVLLFYREERAQAPPTLFGYPGEAVSLGKEGRGRIGGGWVSPPDSSGSEVRNPQPPL